MMVVGMAVIVDMLVNRMFRCRLSHFMGMMVVFMAMVICMVMSMMVMMIMIVVVMMLVIVVVIVMMLVVMIVVMVMLVIVVMIVMMLMPLQVNVYTLLFFPMDCHFHMCSGDPALY